MKASRIVLAAAAASLLAGGALAAEVSYNIGAVSLYKSSGVDQDYDDADATGAPFNKNIRPAIQGGIDLDLGNGFYLGNWNSTGKFEKSNLEIDLYGGYAGELGNGLGYDIGYAHYVYPGMAAWNGGELVLKVSYADLTVKLQHGLNGSTKDASLGAKQRLSFSYDLQVNDQTSVNFTYGTRNKANGNFADYAVGVSYDLGGDTSLSATLSGATKKSQATNGERKSRLVVGVSKSF